MSDLFTDGAINLGAVQEHLGDEFYNDPDTKQQPTKMFDNVPDMTTFVKNYASAQRTISKGEADFAEKTKGMVRIPVDGDGEDVIKAYRKATGVPDSADGYKMDIPDGDDKESFTGIAETIKAAALEAGAPAGLVSGIWGKVVETMQGQFKAIEDKGRALMKTEEDAMRSEHKEKYDTYIKGTDAALLKFKAGAEVKALFDTYGIGNTSAIRKLLAEIAPLVNEGKTVFGESTSGKQGGDDWPIDYDETLRPEG